MFSRGRKQVTLALAALLLAGFASAGTVLAAVGPAEASQPAAGGGWGLTASVALVVGLGCIGGGYAVGRVGSAALGALSERPELFGKALVFVGLAEGIAIYGLIIGIILMFR